MDIVKQLHLIEEEDKVPIEESLYLKCLIAKKHFLTIDRVIERFHPFYTLHDHKHSNTIINNLTAFELANVMKADNLNKYELFLLCASAYLHDVGMIVINDGDQEKSREKGIELFELIRKYHHERSYEHILKFKDRLYLEDSEAHNLALVAKGHRKVNLYNNAKYKPTLCPDNSNKLIRLDLLAALLRIADELDISYMRAEKHIKEILEKSQKFDLITQLHWFKHYYTEGAEFEFTNLHTISPRIVINVKFRYPNHSYKNGFILPHVVKPIKEELNCLNPIFQKYGFSIEFGKSDYTVVESLSEIPTELKENISEFLLQKVNIKVLIIDDYELARLNFSEIVTELGYQWNTAKDSIEAMERIREDDYHLILLDLKLPDIKNRLSERGGIELIEKIRHEQPECIIMVISALKKDPELVVECMERGASAYIEKTSEREEVKKKILQTLEKNFHSVH